MDHPQRNSHQPDHEIFESQNFKGALNEIVKGYMYDNITSNLTQLKKHQFEQNELHQNTQSKNITNTYHQNPIDNPIDSFYDKIVKSLIQEYLKNEKLYQTEGVYIPEANIVPPDQFGTATTTTNFFNRHSNEVLSRNEIVNIFINKGAFGAYNLEKCIGDDKLDLIPIKENSNSTKNYQGTDTNDYSSLIKELIKACFPNRVNLMTESTSTKQQNFISKRDKSIQCDGVNYYGIDELDRKLLDIEKDYYTKAFSQKSNQSDDMSNRLKKALDRAKKELKIEMEEEKRVWKETEQKSMKEEEKDKWQVILRKFCIEMESKVKHQQITIRNKDESNRTILETQERQIRSYAHEVTKKLLQEGGDIDLNKDKFLIEKQQLFENYRKKEIELEKRQHELKLKEAELELIDKGRDQMHESRLRTNGLGEELGKKLLVIKREELEQERDEFEKLKTKYESIGTILDDYKSMLAERDKEVNSMVEKKKIDNRKQQAFEESYEMLIQMSKKNELLLRDYESKYDNIIKENANLKNLNKEIRELLGHYSGANTYKLENKNNKADLNYNSIL